MKLYCYTFLLLLLCFTLVIEAAKKQPKRHPKKQVPKKIKPNKEVPNNEVPQKQVPKKVTSKPKSAPKPATKEAPKKVTSKPKSPKKTTKKPSVHLDDSARNKYIADGKKQYYKRLLGGFAPTKHDLHIASIARLNQTTNDDIFMRQVFEEMPKSFDARKKWPDCPTIAEIQDQSRCGADWAVSSAAAMADRACIGSNKERKPHISATDLMSCCTDCRGTAEDGCQGGYAYRAWIFYTNKGIVTGGEFGSNQGCRPYTFGASNSPKVKGGYSSPECLKQCKDGKDYYAEKHYGIDVVYPDTVETIQQEIYKNGPLTAYMEVHEDLISYQSGNLQRKCF
ncbi:Pept-C1 domain-containing protein [Aphelenchoides bicaudatus]|nr:Pept-C1 domain-containing protein [Aphelenchoides bicaudatus]